MPIIQSTFSAAPWLPGAHAQTLWPFLMRRTAALPYRRERLELADGDFLDLDHSDVAAGARRLLVLHGLEGCSRSAYVQGLIRRMNSQGWNATAMNLRGCSGEPNRLARAYHAGQTDDLTAVVTHLLACEPHAQLSLAGFSLGGNIVLKWLGEQGDAAPVRNAVAVSVPFVLRELAQRMQQGFSRLYQAHFIRLLGASYRRKFVDGDLPPPHPPELVRQLRTFFAFDDAVTARLHGFDGVDDYYARASCRPWLGRIAVPTHIVQALDDPFMTVTMLPPADELPPAVTLELAAGGGHVGFVNGLPWQPHYWLDARLADILETAA